MNIKLVSLVLVAVLLGSSLGSIIAVTQTKVVDGASGGSAQAAPHFAQLNPDFVKYQQSLSAGNVPTGVSAQAGSGFVPPPIDLSQLKGQSVRSALVSSPNLPSSYDLRTQNKLTSVKDQGTCGDCWAFAAYASLESYLRPSETRDFSENNMNNNHGFDIAACAGGNEFMATAYLARWSGPVNEGSNSPVQKHVQDVYFVPNRISSTDNDNIKKAIMTYGAVYTQMYIAPLYPSQYNRATNAYYDPDSSTGVNHGVAIVGWNDNYLAGNFVGSPRGNGAWIVKNSWGSGWGDSGYFYVSYYDANIGQDNAAFTAQPTTNYNNIYQYDPLGDTQAFGPEGKSEWGANVFTAKSSENLATVSFYTHSLNAPYEVYIYTDPAAGPINAAGPAAHVTGTIALPGYHTISLGSSVSLRAGQKFSVVVKFTSTSPSISPVPTEDPLIGYTYSSQARANPGESYYHADDDNWSQGSTWADMTSYSRDSKDTNICIKAFTTTAAPVGGPVASSPAACAQDANSLDLFAKGTDNALWRKHWDGQTWSTSTSLGGYLTSDPAAVSRAAGKIDVYARGGDGALWSRYTTNGGASWANWYKIGGQLASGTGPAACAQGANSLDVFVQGTDHALWHKSSQGSAWDSLGGYLTSGPAATSSTNGRIDVYARGGDGALWQRTYNNGWSSWTSLGGQIAPGTGPAACSWGAGRLDVFVEGTNGALYHRGYNGAWSGWENLGGSLTSSPAAATAPGSSIIDVFVRGGDNRLWEKTFNGGWFAWTSAGGM